MKKKCFNRPICSGYYVSTLCRINAKLLDEYINYIYLHTLHNFVLPEMKGNGLCAVCGFTQLHPGIFLYFLFQNDWFFLGNKTSNMKYTQALQDTPRAQNRETYDTSGYGYIKKHHNPIRNTRLLLLTERLLSFWLCSDGDWRGTVKWTYSFQRRMLHNIFYI